MARLARIVVPGLPHQVTQRGNRREAIFFEDDDQHFRAQWKNTQVVNTRVAGSDTIVITSTTSAAKP